MFLISGRLGACEVQLTLAVTGFAVLQNYYKADARPLLI